MKSIVTLLGLLFVITAQAAAPLIWQSSDYAKFLTRQGYRLFDNKEYRSLTVDPTAGAGVAAPIGSIGVRDNAGSGEVWVKIGAADTAWSNALTGSSGWGLLGNTATDDTLNFLGTTDAEDLAVRTNNVERLRIHSDGQVQLFPNEILAQGTVGAVAGSHNSLLLNQVFSDAIGGSLFGFNNGTTVQGAITSGYVGYNEAGVFANGSSGTYTGLNIAPQFQAGSAIGNTSFIQTNAQIAAGTMVGSDIAGVSVNPVVSSNINGMNSVTAGPSFSGSSSYYNGYNDQPLWGATSSMSTNAKSFNASPTITSGATYQSGTGYFSNITVPTGVTINDFTAFQDSSDIDSAISYYTGLNLGPNGSGNHSSVSFVSANPNMSGDNTNVTGFSFDGTAGDDITNLQGLRVNTTATGTVTNWTGAQLSGTLTATNATGLQVNLSNITSSNRKFGLDITDGFIRQDGTFTTTSSSPFVVDSGNQIAPTFSVLSGSPISDTDVIGNNLAVTMDLQDDYTSSGAFGLGAGMVGYVGQIQSTAGATADRVFFGVAGGSVPAASTGGTITNLYGMRSAGLLNAGGTISVTNQYGFYVDSGFDGFATNSWGLYVADASAQNYFAGEANADGGFRLSTAGAQPTCDASNRGKIWNIQGGAGVADEYEICQKNAADVYVWQSVGSGLDLSQYLFLPGRSGGQVATGGTDASDNLTLRSTTDATKGQVILDETTASTSPTTGALRVDGGVGVGGAVNVAGAVRSNTSLVLEDPGVGTNTTTIQAGTVTTSYSVTLPPAQGAVNTTLINDGSGVLSWGVVSSTPDLFGTRSVPRTIVAGTGITSGASDMSTTAPRQIVFVDGSGGVDITASPQVEAGTVVGQEMRVCGTDDTDFVLLENGDGLSLNGDAQLGKDDCINLTWLGSDGVTSDWVEQSRNF